MAKPLVSKFITEGKADTLTTLFSGKADITTPVLTKELGETETEHFFVDSANGIVNSGFAVIGDEILSYSSRFGKSKIRYLVRGVNGTVPVTHLIGSPVTFTPNYYIPDTLIHTVIAMQELLLSHKDEIEALKASREE